MESHSMELQYLRRDGWRLRRSRDQLERFSFHEILSG